jgi:hypothetical protein
VSLFDAFDDDDTGKLVVTLILFGNVCTDGDDGDEQLKSLSCSTLIIIGVVVDASSILFVICDGDNELLRFNV